MHSSKPRYALPEIGLRMFETTSIETSFGTCALKRTERKTLGISVLPDGSIELAAPHECTVDSIVEKMILRRRWIQRQRANFEVMNASRPKLRYCSGATHRYLGRQYRLRISEGEQRSVKLKGGYFEISTDDSTEHTVKRLLETWMRDHASQQFAKRLSKWNKWCQHRQLPLPKLSLRKMPKRWGSAHSDGRIFLNPDLIRAPALCIEYVIAHEVSHLKYPSHDSSFYQLLNENCPNWKKLKLRLEKAEF